MSYVLHLFSNRAGRCPALVALTIPYTHRAAEMPCKGLARPGCSSTRAEILPCEGLKYCHYLSSPSCDTRAEILPCEGLKYCHYASFLLRPHPSSPPIWCSVRIVFARVVLLGCRFACTPDCLSSHSSASSDGRQHAVWDARIIMGNVLVTVRPSAIQTRLKQFCRPRYAKVRFHKLL